MMTISFKQQLNKLRAAGFTEQQVQAIWQLVSRVAIDMTNAALEYSGHIVQGDSAADEHIWKDV